MRLRSSSAYSLVVQLHMNLARGFLLALGFIQVGERACARANDDGGGFPPARRDVFTRFAEEGVYDVGVRFVHRMGSGEEQVEQDLVASLEADAQVTGEAGRQASFSFSSATPLRLSYPISFVWFNWADRIEGGTKQRKALDAEAELQFSSSVDDVWETTERGVWMVKFVPTEPNDLLSSCPAR